MTTQTCLLRLPEVMARTSLSKRTIYRKMADGTFPKSRTIGNKSVAWLDSSIEKWIHDLPESDPKDWHHPNCDDPETESDSHKVA